MRTSDEAFVHYKLIKFACMHDKRVLSELCEHVATVSCTYVHLCDCFPMEGHKINMHYA